MKDKLGKDPSSSFVQETHGTFWKREFLDDPSFLEFVDLIPEATIFSEPSGEIILTNIASQSTFGYTAEEFLNLSVEALVPLEVREEHPKMREHFFKNPMPRFLDGRSVDLKAVRKDGSEFPMVSALFAIHTDQGLVAVNLLRDLTQQRAQEAEIAEMAFVDALTNLPNRRYLETNLARNVARANRYDHQIAMLFIDLDKFKLINDQQGHDVGDAVLKEMAARIGTCIRSSDFVARIGGDEFVIMVYPYKKENDLSILAGRLIELCSEPVVHQGEVYQLSASVGIAMTEPSLADGDLLLKQSDEAMYAAKGKGGATFAYFNEID